MLTHKYYDQIYKTIDFFAQKSIKIVGIHNVEDVRHGTEAHNVSMHLLHPVVTSLHPVATSLHPLIIPMHERL